MISEEFDEEIDKIINDEAPDNQASTTCENYSIVPVVSAVHPCSICSMTFTKNMRWLFTGGDDGMIRKYDFVPSVNSGQMLTIQQKHGLVDSIQLQGVLISAWENEEFPINSPKTALPNVSTSSAPTMQQNPISPVYSMAVHSEGVWLLAGCESGAINLYTVRHDEGSCQYTFRKHNKIVSSLAISPDEKSFVSGSWDKTILQWNLDDGSVIREFSGVSSQVTCISAVPSSIPTSWLPTGFNKKVAGFSFLACSYDGVILVLDTRCEQSVRKLVSNVSPPWALNASWSIDGDMIYCGRRNETVEEWSVEESRILRSIKMPRDSGKVSFVLPMPNKSSLLCASYDNIRLWDLKKVGETEPVLHKGTPMSTNAETTPKKGKSSFILEDITVPFSIIPGHHGEVISCMAIDPKGKFLITSSGNNGWEGNSNNLCLVYRIKPEH